MKTRYRLIRRGNRHGAFYCVDTRTGKRTSLDTSIEDEAQQIIQAKNQAERQPIINLQIARAYLMASDPNVASRTWQIPGGAGTLPAGSIIRKRPTDSSGP